MQFDEARWDRTSLLFYKKLLLESQRRRRLGQKQSPHAVIDMKADSTWWITVSTLYHAADPASPSHEVFELLMDRMIEYSLGKAQDARVAVVLPEVPSKFWLFIAALSFPPATREESLDTMETLYQRNVERFGRKAGRFMLGWDVLGSIAGRAYRATSSEVVRFLVEFIRRWFQ